MPVEIVFLVRRGCLCLGYFPRLFTVIRVACLGRSCHSHQPCRRTIPPETRSITEQCSSTNLVPHLPDLPEILNNPPIFGPLRSVSGRDLNLTALGTHYPEPGPVPTTRRPGYTNPSSRSSCASSWECQLAGGERMGIELIL